MWVSLVPHAGGGAGGFTARFRSFIMRHPLATASLLAATCSMSGGAFAQSITASGAVSVDQQPRSGQLGSPLVAFDVGVGSESNGRSGRLVLTGGAAADIGGSVRVGEGPEATLGLVEVSGFGTDLSAQSLRLGERSGRGVLELSDGAELGLDGRFEVGTQSVGGGGSSFTIGGFATLSAGDTALSSGRGLVEDAGLLRGGSKVTLGENGRFDLEVAAGGRLEASFLDVGGSNGGARVSTLTLGGDADLLRDGSIGPGSRLALEGGSLSAFTLQNNGGAITGSGRINANLRLLSSGSGSRSRVSLLAGETLEVRGNQTDTLSSDFGLIENAGTLDVGGGTLVNLNESSYFGRGGTFRGSNFINAGGASAVDLLSGANSFASAFENRQGARVTVTGGATAVFQDDFRNNGALRIDPGSRATFAGDFIGNLAAGGGESVLLGNLRFSAQQADFRAASFSATAAGEATAAGTRRVQRIEGRTDLSGSQSSLTLRFDADGAFDAFDFVNASPAELVLSDGGTSLMLDVADGFTADNGDRFEVFRFFADGESQITGSFAIGPEDLDLGGGLFFDASELESTGFLTVVPEPGSVALLLGGAGVLLRRRRA